MKNNVSDIVLEKIKRHPCYNSKAHDYARMHIPVAPKCNIQCNYCNRKYDCVNESRPGVTSGVLSPEEAAAKYTYVKDNIKNLSVVGIAGPGDALENFEETKKSIELIKENDGDVIFCMSTNGLRLPEYAGEMISLGVEHVTVTMNAVDPEIGARIYEYVYDGEKKLTGIEGASLLLERQLEGIKILVENNVLCKVNIVYIKGVNDHHIEEVVKKARELGVFMTNIMPLIPTRDTKFENISPLSGTELKEMRDKCGQHIKQMYHCQQCRADAIGQLKNDRSSEFRFLGCAMRDKMA